MSVCESKSKTFNSILIYYHYLHPLLPIYLQLATYYQTKVDNSYSPTTDP